MNLLSKALFRIQRKIKVRKVNGLLQTGVEIISCPVCNSTYDNHQKIAKTERYGINLESVCCKKCGLIFFNPMPKYAFLYDFYKNYYQSMHRYKVPTLGVINREIERAQRLINVLNTTEISNNASILDIGCSAGHILSELHLQDKNYTLFGVEPDSNYIEYINKNLPFITTYNGMFEDIAFNRKYDLILLMHVFEHMKDLSEILIKLKEIMHNNSMVYIETPNIFRAFDCVKSINNFFLISKLYTFSPTTIETILNNHGFEVVNIQDQINKHMSIVFKLSRTNMPLRSTQNIHDNHYTEVIKYLNQG